MSSDNDIRKQFQEKFNDFKVEVPADGWDRLEDALNAARVVPMPHRRWRYAISAAAAVFLLIIGSLLLVQQPWDQSTPMLSESSDLIEFTTPATTPLSSALETEPGPVGGGVGKPDVTSPSRASRARSHALLVAEATTHPVKYDIRPTHSAGITNVGTHHKRVEQAIAEMDTHVLNTMMVSLDRSDRAEEHVVIATDLERLPIEYTRSRQRKPIHLALTGRGGLTSYHQTVNTPMTLRSASADDDIPEKQMQNSLVVQNIGDNVSQMEHDQPISFGITVSKEILDDLYVETGLVYSYLYSKARNTNVNFRVQETQRLHYIGVPVNVNYNVVSFNRLNVYASVGGMIEKDVYGDFRRMGEGETTNNTRSEELEVVKISQRDPQISVNAGVGLSYPIYNRLRLYGKIGGSYYFDTKNVYKTIYSDRKIVMDLNVGFRYEF